MKCYDCKEKALIGLTRCASCRERHRKANLRYSQRPEVKVKRRAYSHAYFQRPEVKVKRRAYSHAYFQRPEVKAKQRAYNQAHAFGIELRRRIDRLQAIPEEQRSPATCERLAGLRMVLLKNEAVEKSFFDALRNRHECEKPKELKN